MAEHSTIEWTDATAIVDRGGRRVRMYRRKDLSRPGQQERRAQAALGLRWCRDCRSWLPQAEVTKNGLCRPHEAASTRKRYAESPTFRSKRKAHSTRHRRGVEPVPDAAVEALTEWFEGRCAYCPAPAVAWDHFNPVAKGGRTVPGNMLPVCTPCNSSKKDGDPIAWLNRAPDVSPFAIELLSHAGLI